MKMNSNSRSILKNCLKYTAISMILFGFTLHPFSNLILIKETPDNFYLTLNSTNNAIKTSDNPFKIDLLTNSNPESYFPNFLFYSVEIANALIDHLYDNTSGGFYILASEQWANSSINFDKRTYDNAQAILAFLKLSDAVINQTEKDFALEIAEKTAKCMITDLYDVQFNGFFTRQENRLKKPGIQATAIQALLSLYEKTGNETYREKAFETYDFLISGEGWNSIDDDNGYFIYLLSHSGLAASTNPDITDPYNPESIRVDHNALMGAALLDLYIVESNDDYLLKARQIYNFLNTTCRNSTTNLFYTGLNKNNEVVENSSADIFVNSLVLEFLAKLYDATENPSYYKDFFIILNSILIRYWDERYGGFYATYSYVNPELRDKKKYTERLFYGIRALDEAYRLTNNSLYYNLILDVVEFLNNKLYDHDYLGYFLLTNNDGSPGDPYWNNKYAITQALSVYSLSNLWMYSKPSVLNAHWTPSTPRPEDSVTITVAAFDSDGISNVLFNYSLNDDPYKTKDMVPDSDVGSLFNTSMETQPSGTKINFNVIVNDTLGNLIDRGSYFFLWQNDRWAPEILEIGFIPGIEIPVHSEFAIIVSAQDVPVQGEVKYIRMYYHSTIEDEISIALERIDIHLWKVTFPEGFPVSGTYGYYFEAIDDVGNYGYTSQEFFRILGHKETIPLSLVIGGLLIILIFVPGGIYGYVYYDKRRAKKTLKGIRITRKELKRRRRGKRIRN